MLTRATRAKGAYAQPDRVASALEWRDIMGEKSVRKSSGKTAASKTLKEKRVAKADKKAASDRQQNHDAVSRAAKN